MKNVITLVSVLKNKKRKLINFQDKGDEYECITFKRNVTYRVIIIFQLNVKKNTKYNQ